MLGLETRGPAHWGPTEEWSTSMDGVPVSLNCNADESGIHRATSVPTRPPKPPEPSACQPLQQPAPCYYDPCAGASRAERRAAKAHPALRGRVHRVDRRSRWRPPTRWRGSDPGARSAPSAARQFCGCGYPCTGGAIAYPAAGSPPRRKKDTPPANGQVRCARSRKFHLPAGR